MILTSARSLFDDVVGRPLGVRVDAIDAGFRRSRQLPGGVCGMALGRRIQAARGVRGFSIAFRWASRRHRREAVRARCARKRACQSDDSGAVAGESSARRSRRAFRGWCLHHAQSIEPGVAERQPVGAIRKGSTRAVDPIRQGSRDRLAASVDHGVEMDGRIPFGEDLSGVAHRLSRSRMRHPGTL